MDFNDDWSDDSDLPDRVPPKEDRLWAHPSEYSKRQKKRFSKILGVLGGLALIFVGLVAARTIWPTKQADTLAPKAGSSLTLGVNTSSHIDALAKAVVKISLPGVANFTIYGLAISRDGYILVPAHVLKSTQTYTATFTNHTSIPATLIAVDTTTDTAVLKVNDQLVNYISGISQRAAKSGEMTIGIGPSTNSNEPKLILSQIQQTGLTQTLPGGERSVNSYLADAAQKLNPEGLLFVDSHGNPLGIGISQINDKWLISPLAEMLTAAQQIELVNGTPSGWLGIVGTSVSPPNGQGNASGNGGVYVYSVVTNSPAQKGGIIPKDEIVALNGRSISGLPDLQAKLAEFPSGSQISLTLLRNGQTMRVTIQLGKKS